MVLQNRTSELNDFDSQNLTLDCLLAAEELLRDQEEENRIVLCEINSMKTKIKHGLQTLEVVCNRIVATEENQDENVDFIESSKNVGMLLIIVGKYCP